MSLEARSPGRKGMLGRMKGEVAWIDHWEGSIDNAVRMARLASGGSLQGH